MYDELCRIVADEPELLDGFFALTPCQKADVARVAAPLARHRARGRLHDRRGPGDRRAQLRHADRRGRGRGAGPPRRAERPGARDPNVDLGSRFCAMVSTLAERLPQAAPRAVGIVYPTEFTEDLPLVRLYRRWLEAARLLRSCSARPTTSTHDDAGLVALRAAASRVMLRHYKTDWWGERASAWDDEDIPDADASDDRWRRCSTPLPRGKPRSSTRSARSCRRTSARWPSCGSTSIASRPRAQALFERYVPVHVSAGGRCTRSSCVAERERTGC